MKEHKRVRLSGSLRVPLSPQEAFTLFTPSGERSWAHGWDPRFLTEITDETEPGTVFQTDHAGAPTTWMVVRREPGEMIEYARVTGGDQAGIVRVTCEPAADGATTATVAYDLTALSAQANPELDDFAKDYPHYLERWRQAIEHAIMSQWPLPPATMSGPTTSSEPETGGAGRHI